MRSPYSVSVGESSKDLWYSEVHAVTNAMHLKVVRG